MILAWHHLGSAWLGVAIMFMIVALLRREAGNYLEFCQVLGLCALWPITLTLEIALAWHHRKARQAKPQV